MEKGKLEFDLPEDESAFLAAINGMKYKVAVERTLYFISRVLRGKERLFDDVDPDNMTEAERETEIKILEKISQKLQEECEGVPLD